MTLEEDDAARFRAYRESRDPEQLAALMVAYDSLARSIARRYHINDAMWSHEDLEQVAREGLLNAINRYDPDGLHRGRTFPTVAQFAIRHQIRRATGLDIAPDIADEDTIPLPSIRVTPLTPPTWMQDRTTRPLDTLAEVRRARSMSPMSTATDMACRSSSCGTARAASRARCRSAARPTGRSRRTCRRGAGSALAAGRCSSTRWASG